MPSLRKAARKRRPRFGAETVGALILAYKASPEWARLADATKRNYATYLKVLEASPHDTVAAVTRRDILAVRDAIATTRGHGAASGFLRSASALFAWAVDREWIDVTPVIRIKALPRGSLPAWSDDHVARALSRLAEPLRRAVVLAAYTGQRRGDLCALRWDAYEGGKLRFTQQKTGQPMVLTVAPELKREMDTWRRDAATLTILHDGKNQPWKPARLTEQLRRALAKIGMKGMGIHGVRKHVAANLAAHGATTHEIAAVTGHRTLAMVQHYTESVDRERLAEQAENRLAQRTPKLPVRR
jgi:integrase